MTGHVWFDATSSTTEPRYFRARAASPWTEGVSSAAVAQRTGYVGLTAGYGYTCGIRTGDNKVLCWGRDDEGQGQWFFCCEWHVGVLE